MEGSAGPVSSLWQQVPRAPQRRAAPDVWAEVRGHPAPVPSRCLHIVLLHCNEDESRGHGLLRAGAMFLHVSGGGVSQPHGRPLLSTVNKLADLTDRRMSGAFITAAAIFVLPSGYRHNIRCRGTVGRQRRRAVIAGRRVLRPSYDSRSSLSSCSPH